MSYPNMNVSYLHKQMERAYEVLTECGVFDKGDAELKYLYRQMVLGHAQSSDRTKAMTIRNYPENNMLLTIGLDAFDVCIDDYGLKMSLKMDFIAASPLSIKKPLRFSTANRSIQVSDHRDLTKLLEEAIEKT